MTVTKSTFERGNLTWAKLGNGGLPGNTAPLMSVYSAFSPFSVRKGWFDTGNIEHSPDAFND